MKHSAGYLAPPSKAIVASMVIGANRSDYSHASTASSVYCGWIASTGMNFQFNFVFFAIMGVVAAIAVELIPPWNVEHTRVARTGDPAGALE